VAALRSAGAPAAPSDTAGRFVCNAVLYHSLTGAADARYAGPLGFVHLPGEETLALADQERALERLLRLLAAGPAHATVAAPPLTLRPATAETAHGHNAD
jgi:pyroglutamyl-peptidase